MHVVIVYVEPLYSLDAALEESILEICTLGNWIYNFENSLHHISATGEFFILA